MPECVKGCFTDDLVNIGWYGFETTKAASIRVGPGHNFQQRTRLGQGRRVGVQSTRNPKGVDDPPIRPAHKNGGPWVWVYDPEDGMQGWMMWKVLRERTDTVPWARGPSNRGFHVGIDLCPPKLPESCHGYRRNRVRTVSAKEVFLRYSTRYPFHYLQQGDSVRELYRRELNDYVSVSVTRSATCPIGTRGWVDVRALAGEKAFGIDVSSFQGTIDFNAVRASGEDFVIAKATEGESFIDKNFFKNVKAARKARLHVGAYHFLRPRPGRSGSAEADDFIRALKLAKIGPTDIRPSIDVEASKLDREGTERYVGEFVGAMRMAGYDSMLYTYPAFLKWTKAFNTDLWIANYEVQKPNLPTPWSDYALWQYTSKGSVPGVVGRVDRNKCPDLSRIIQG